MKYGLSTAVSSNTRRRSCSSSLIAPTQSRPWPCRTVAPAKPKATPTAAESIPCHAQPGNVPCGKAERQRSLFPKRVVCTRVKCPLIPASVSRRWLSLCSSILPLSILPPLKGRSYYLLPLKGSSCSRTLSLSIAISFFS